MRKKFKQLKVGPKVEIVGEERLYFKVKNPTTEKIDLLPKYWFKGFKVKIPFVIK